MVLWTWRPAGKAFRMLVAPIGHVGMKETWMLFNFATSLHWDDPAQSNAYAHLSTILWGQVAWGSKAKGSKYGIFLPFFSGASRVMAHDFLLAYTVCLLQPQGAFCLLLSKHRPQKLPAPHSQLQFSLEAVRWGECESLRGAWRISPFNQIFPLLFLLPSMAGTKIWAPKSQVQEREVEIRRESNQRQWFLTIIGSRPHLKI